MEKLKCIQHSLDSIYMTYANINAQLSILKNNSDDLKSFLDTAYMKIEALKQQDEQNKLHLAQLEKDNVHTFRLNYLPAIREQYNCSQKLHRLWSAQRVLNLQQFKQISQIFFSNKEPGLFSNLTALSASMIFWVFFKSYSLPKHEAISLFMVEIKWWPFHSDPS